MSAAVTDVAFAPLLPWWTLALAALAAAALLLHGLARGAPGMAWRALVLATVLATLANPSVVRERRESLPDVAVVVVDRSASQSIGERPRQTDEALAAMTERLGRLDGLELRVVEAGPEPAGADGAGPGSGTRLFAAARRAIADLPRGAVSGLLLLTDGQVHDAPRTLEALGLDAPVHALLSGRGGETDRRLELVAAPRYGIVDKPVAIVFRIVDGEPGGGSVAVTLAIDERRPLTYRVPVGERYEVRFVPDHAGTTVVRLDAAPREGELTTVNNGGVLAVNGIRENLKVLLISGEVHTGARVWRNSLKSDTSVELVHFTILRPPDRQDNTPLHELSLIPFPVRELFEVKLRDFDLIIFDRYRKRGVIPEPHLEAIADYVLEGGAMMIAAGPDFGSPLGLATTVLGEIMPLAPTGGVIERPFAVSPTEAGLRHPVTAALPGIHREPPPWGRWFRQIETRPGGGEVLLAGADGLPLLVLSRVGEGRVAELLSDQLWLWARGVEGGGPSQELLRRTAHWLMKEPELEENALRAGARDNRIHIVRQSLEDRDREVTLVAPSGSARTLTLSSDAPGAASAEITVDEAGLYRVVDDALETVVPVGEPNPREWRQPVSTDALLMPIVEASGGGIARMGDGGWPSVRRVDAGRDRSGPGWIGFVDHGRYRVRGIDTRALLPAWLALALLLGGLALAWRAEGR